LILTNALVQAAWPGTEELWKELSKAPLATAFQILMDSLGILQPIGGTPQPAVPLFDDQQFFPRGEHDVLDRFSTVRLLLVDDQFSLGYHDILATVLFGRRDEYQTIRSAERARSVRSAGHSVVTIESVASPTILLDALNTSFPGVADWEMPHLVGKDLFDVLVLDLRLFSDSTLESPSRSEQEFLGELLSFYERSGARKIADHWLTASMRRLLPGLRAKKRTSWAWHSFHFCLAMLTRPCRF
jgi:hypothetical protein